MLEISRIKLEQVLIARGMTLEDLKTDGPVSARTIERILSRTNMPRMRTIKQLCEFLKCCPDDIGAFVAKRTENSSENDSASPYVVGLPIHNEIQFVGREIELSRLKQLVAQSPMQNAAIFGPTGIGKSSLVNIINDHAETDAGSNSRNFELKTTSRNVWCVNSFKDPRILNPSALYKSLLESVGISETCELDSIRFLEAFTNAADGRTVVVLEDVDVLARKEHSITDDVWNTMRYLCTSSKGTLSFILTSRESLDVLAGQLRSDSPFFNIFAHIISLKPFTDLELTKLFARSPVTFSTDDIAWMSDIGKGHPAAMQYLCNLCLGNLLDADPIVDDSWRDEAMSNIVHYLPDSRDA